MKEKRMNLLEHVANFSDKDKKAEHKEISVWIENQYEQYGFPIASLAEQVSDFNSKELIQVIHWINHKAEKMKAKSRP